VSNLPLGDGRASAFNQVDRGSTAIVGPFPTDYTAHGGGGNVVSNTHFTLSMAAFYGLPPALLQPFIGKHKCANCKLLDEFGDNLVLSNMAGDGWRKRHDVFKWGLSRWMSGPRWSQDVVHLLGVRPLRGVHQPGCRHRDKRQEEAVDHPRLRHLVRLR